MTATYPAAGPNILQIQVRRTAGGAVTASTSIPAANMGWGNNITAAANDRAFFIGRYPCRSTTAAVTTFYRIAITGSGRISGMAPAGRPVQGCSPTSRSRRTDRRWPTPRCLATAAAGNPESQRRVPSTSWI